MDGDRAADISHSVRTGVCRARDVVEAALDRARRDEHNAIVTMCEARAIREADAVDAAIARGADPGPLAGVPFTAKDTIATAGVRTTAGSRLFADHVPVRDAPSVARLRAAGAVLVGKTNCPEFALQARTDNAMFGPTHHPVDPAMSPGGSSGGCAVAVAAGIVPLSLGGDYGGSVRYPAGCTGGFGLRPTRGAVDATGTLPPPPAGSPRDRFQTIGPLARHVDDLTLALEALSAPLLAPADVTRIGIVHDGWPVDAAIAAATDRFAHAATSAGYAVEAIGPDPFTSATEVFDAWRATDDYADLRARATMRDDDLTPHIRTLLRGTVRRESDRDFEAETAALLDTVAQLLARTPVIALPIALVGVVPLDATEVAIDGKRESLDSLRILAPSRAISLLGLPALAVPAGSDDRGLPVGVQLVGAPNTEATLLSVARRVTTTR